MPPNARIKEDDESAPVPHDGYFYYIRTEKGKQYPYYCRKQGSLEVPEEILLDPHRVERLVRSLLGTC